MIRRQSRGFEFKGKTVAALIALTVVTGTGATAVYHSDRDTYRVRVIDTEGVVEADRDDTRDNLGGIKSRYLVFTKDLDTGIERVFENTDSLMECLFGRCKYNSSDLQAKLKDVQGTDTECSLRTYGWRIPLFSVYENIVGAECKKK